jgi:two-component system LytT family response regulator
VTYRTVIVDDEAPARRRLLQLLKAHPEVVVVGEAATGDEAVALLMASRPDLVFLDIQLPQHDGFEVLRRVLEPPMVIFTTAHDQYALQAFEAASIDYLLKPIEAEILGRALAKLRRFENASDQTLSGRVQEMLRLLAASVAPQYLQKMAVRVGERALLLEVEEVAYFEAKDKYVFLYTTAGKEYIVDYTLADLEQRLHPQKFVRVHRSTLVNIDHVREIQNWFGGKYRLILSDKKATELVVSKGMAGRFKTLIPF